MERLEETDLFQQASCIALYHAIPGEVQTDAFIEKWYHEKQLLLPVIEGNDLRLVPYREKETLKAGIFGILEPLGVPAVSDTDIDLIIVPGIAFDRSLNRMGRGKGYYDRLLSVLQVPKIGICFGFQLVDEVPVESFDKKMNCIISENEIITG